MAAEPYVIHNPKENNRLLTISTVNANGQPKTIAILKPGQTFRADQDLLTIKVVALPAKLLVEPDGQVRPDPSNRPMRLRPTC